MLIIKLQPPNSTTLDYRRVVFNLCIVGSVENVTCDSLQYADDSTLYKHLKAKNLKKKCIEELGSHLETVLLWSSNNS